MPTYIKKTCQHCGEEFEVCRGDEYRKFCSSSCAAKYNNARRTTLSRKKQQETLKKTYEIKYEFTAGLSRKEKEMRRRIIRDMIRSYSIDYDLERIPPSLKLIVDLYIKPISVVIHKQKYFGQKPKESDKKTRLIAAKSVIEHTSLFLNKDKTSITIEDINNFKLWVYEKVHIDNWTPRQIKEYLGSTYSEFGMFIKSTLKIPIKTLPEYHQYIINVYKELRPEKEQYWHECRFTFDPFTCPNIKGYELLGNYKFYDPITNPNGLCRDHMLSIYEGWVNKIDPKIISHPANCHIMFGSVNFSKNIKSSITLEDLLLRIEQWDNNPHAVQLKKIMSSLPKTEEQRKKISETNKNLRTYTNGLINLRQHKDLPVPEGFRSGMVRKNGGGRETRTLTPIQKATDFANQR